MILHYANLCVIAGGVDLFLIGSEFRGLETVRGPSWTRAGSLVGGAASWDYPFVAGLAQLADDVRGIFDAASLTRDAVRLKNLIAYSADWSDWMGVQHPDAAGQWPHLDQLYAHPSIDLVSFDNYLPLSDWTSTGGLDAVNWSAPAPTTWPPGSATMNGLGLAGQPSLYTAGLPQGQHRGWREIRLVLRRFDEPRTRPRSGGIGPPGFAPARRSADTDAQRLRGQPAASRQQAGPVVVEQSASGDLRRRRRAGVCAAWAGDGLGSAVEVDHLRGIRFSFLRSLHQSAQRLLRSQIQRERHAVLVGLGKRRGRELPPASRRSAGEPRAIRNRRILDQRRP